MELRAAASHTVLERASSGRRWAGACKSRHSERNILQNLRRPSHSPPLPLCSANTSRTCPERALGTGTPRVAPHAMWRRLDDTAADTAAQPFEDSESSSMQDANWGASFSNWKSFVALVLLFSLICGMAAGVAIKDVRKKLGVRAARRPARLSSQPRLRQPRRPLGTDHSSHGRSPRRRLRGAKPTDPSTRALTPRPLPLRRTRAGSCAGSRASSSYCRSWGSSQ